MTERGPVLRRRLRIALLATILAVSGPSCGLLRGKLPPQELYRLALPDPTIELSSAARRDEALVAARPPLAGALAIAEYRTPGIYGGQNIVFRIDDHQYGAYPSREWALPLAMMLGAITERVLLAHPLSTEPAVYDPPTRLAHPYSWHGTVREFEEVNRGRNVFVSVVLDLRLIRTADEKVVWQGSADVEHAVPEPTMLAIIEALSAAAAEAVTRLATEARADLERRPPTARR